MMLPNSIKHKQHFIPKQTIHIQHNNIKRQINSVKQMSAYVNIIPQMHHHYKQKHCKN